MVPTTLPRQGLEAAFDVLELPLHLNWSDRGRRFDLRDRRQRARVYELVLREGTPDDVLAYVDGVLLVDLWGELVLPPPVRAAWQPVVMGEGNVRWRDGGSRRSPTFRSRSPGSSSIWRNPGSMLSPAAPHCWRRS